MSIGYNIKRLREQEGLTQEELAKVLGVTAPTISYWESDKKIPRMGVLQRMADLFGVLKSEIIEGNLTDGRTLFALYSRMNDENKLKAESFIRFLAQEELKNNPE